MRGIPEATVIILMAEERAELEGLAADRMGFMESLV